MRRARKPAADHDDDIRGRQDRSERGRRTHHSVERHHHHESHSHHLPRQHSVEDLQRAVSQDTPKNLPNLKRWQSEEPMRHRPAGLKRSVSDLEDKEPTLSGAKTNLAQLGSFYGNGAWKQTHASRVQQLRGDGAKGLQATPADPSPVRASSFRPHHMAKQTTIFSASTSQLYDTPKIQQMQQVTPQSLEESELKKQTEWLNTIKKETAELEQRALRLDGQLQSWHEVKLNLKAEVACRIRETQEGLRGLETLLETTSVMLGKEKTLTETASTRQVKAYEELARVQEKAYWVHEHARDLEMRLGKQRDEVCPRSDARPAFQRCSRCCPLSRGRNSMGWR